MGSYHPQVLFGRRNLTAYFTMRRRPATLSYFISFCIQKMEQHQWYGTRSCLSRSAGARPGSLLNVLAVSLLQGLPFSTAIIQQLLKVPDLFGCNPLHVAVLGGGLMEIEDSFDDGLLHAINRILFNVCWCRPCQVYGGTPCCRCQPQVKVRRKPAA
jgi:hypothetical protein